MAFTIRPVEYYYATVRDELGLSLETAGLVPTLRPWITNEFLHSGLRVGGGDLLDRLLRMTRRA